MRRTLVLTAVASVMIFALAAYGHHSIGATYDGSKDVKLEG
jgi:hypothetical protein